MDKLLKRLGEVPPPTALGGIDDAIIAAWSAEQRDRASQSRVLSAAALVALGLGFAGGSLSGVPAKASTTLSPFTSAELAPSSLLEPHR
jgi:hypothetical protein